MGRASCKAAINAQSFTAGDGCGNSMRALEFVMNSADWFRLSETFRAEMVARATAADEQYILDCQAMCQKYEKILSHIDAEFGRISGESAEHVAAEEG